ncbi:uncharacterized protein LOC128550515 [Mercenaria mercenaria]|uniref:uncharacterized protein LOC128550515 n=1 Tax=Mercenaria mercenaria TaxID=6596 RepID=UPI00234F33C1|nr:uncharacterized protein LOC128550515 [Mercenaria mercenaria]
MKTESFMLAVRRFISRQSTPKVFISDNALTFIATAKIMKEEVLNPHGITWKFIPQHAPWYGGWWERLIGLTKTSLKKVLGKALINLETLQTLITEVECIINDRPLTHSSTDPTDDVPLTPSHLLYGRRITTPIYPDDREEPEADDMSRDKADKLYRFKSATIEHFWSRWKHEYLTSLREFHKHLGGEGDLIRIGDVVQIHDDTLLRSRWSLGVIDDVVTGADGRTRAARVKSRKGIITRPIAKLYPLELIE